jgi:integrase
MGTGADLKTITENICVASAPCIPNTPFAATLRDKLPTEASSQRKGISLARRRYQKGTLILRGKREQKWIGRWLEDEILPTGELVRHHRSEVIGTKKEFPTKRLAQRQLDARVSVVNNPTYRARPTATFRELADRWQTKVLPNHAVATQRSEKSDIHALNAAIGDVAVKDIDTELLQDMVASWKGSSPKTVRNRITTFRLIWDKAKAWNYAAHTPYEGLDLPAYIRAEQPSFSPEDVARIIAASKPPYDIVWRLAAECGIRRGEIAGLNVGDVSLAALAVTVKRSVTRKRQMKSPKNGKVRVFAISSQLAAKVLPLVENRNADEPLFLSAEGKRLEPDNFVKRHLKPVVKKLGLVGGCHGFRHGNASMLDHLGAPMRVRQDRLGHADPKTTMGYTHAISADERNVAAQLGALLQQEFLAQDLPKTITAQERNSQAVV